MFCPFGPPVSAQIDLRYQYADSELNRLPWLPLYHRCLPELIDYGNHILVHMEQYCRLVSSSGIVRVDLGVEVKEVVPVVGSGDTQRECELRFCRSGEVRERAVQEEEKKDAPVVRRGWQSTGRGVAVRCLCNEVTTSLDIGWFMVREE